MLVFAIENKVSKFLLEGFHVNIDGPYITVQNPANSPSHRADTLCEMQTAFTIVSIKVTQNRYFCIYWQTICSMKSIDLNIKILQF